MQVQLCKICGERHHRYDPHRFPAAPEVPRSNAPSQIRRKPGTDTKRSGVDLSPQEPASPPGKPDTAPSRDSVKTSVRTPIRLGPKPLAQLSDEEFRLVYNAHQAEYMRRKRARKEKQ